MTVSPRASDTGREQAAGDLVVDKELEEILGERDPLGQAVGRQVEDRLQVWLDLDLECSRIVASEIEVPNTLVNMV